MKILHLEDNREDAALVAALLAEEWPDCRITLVGNRPDYLRELAPGRHDAILSDFTLAQFDGSEALLLAREHAPDTPFIFLSGNIGEDRAIEAVHAGAHDYVLKDRIKRLPTAIQRALRETGERARLRAAEAGRERLAATLESSPDFVGLAEPDGRILYLNAAARRLLGLPPGGLPAGLNVSQAHPTTTAQRILTERFSLAGRDGTWSGESLLLTGDGRLLPVSQVIVAHRRTAGDIEYFSTVMRDLSTRKEAESLVNGQNQVLEMIAGGEPLGDTLTVLLQFIESQAPEMICSILLLREDSRLGSCAGPRIPPAMAAAIDGTPVGPAAGSCGTAAFRRAAVIVTDIATDPLWDDFRHLALPHGFQACWSTPVFDTHHRLLGTFAVYGRAPGGPSERHRRLIDIGTHIAAICLGRHETERQLRDQADILNKAGDAIIVTDSAQRVVFWNRSAERTFGWTATEAIGRQDRELFGPAATAELDAAREAVSASEEWRGEVRLQNRHGQTVIMDSRVTVMRDDAGHPQGRLSISTDITEKKKIEDQFFRAQRLESLGMLSAGIAHDLNNVLAPILLAAPMLRDHASDPADLRMISTLEKSAERGAALVRQILGFAHGADGEHTLMQVKHLLRDVAAFIEETFPKSIRLDDFIPADLWTVKANPTQLHQVLLNLCVNARDAMPEGGTLFLRGENVTLDEDAASQIEDARSGTYLVLHVQDTGTGISPEVLLRIWEPFFTTKASDKGTGLGLSTVRGIVENHGGFVTVQTIQGQGTTFRVHLPAVESGTSPTATPSIGPVAHRGVGELILVVDDEPGIRNMAAVILTRHGYRVLTAADGAEAIALFAPRSKEIRLVVTDMSMPNLDGIALSGVIRRLNHRVRILGVSGFTGNSKGRPSAENVTDAFLFKPFRPELLLTTVHELLRTLPNPAP